MNFNWEEYINLAEHITNSLDSLSINEEACFRNAMSRSYYGIYKIVWRKVEKLGEDLTGYGRDHKIIKDYLINNSDKTKKQIGYLIDSLHRSRIEADYRDEMRGNLEQEAIKSIQHAKKILKLLNTI